MQARACLEFPGAEAMQRKHPCAGSTTVAVTLALFLLIFTLVTVYYFLAKPWFPEPINEMGRRIDAQFVNTLWITGIVFVASQLGLAWAVFRYRDRGQRATYSHGSNKMEVIWTLATVVMFLGLGIHSQSIWASLHFTQAPPDALKIEITGEQFAFNFRYAGADGKFGVSKPELMRASNPVGLDPSDAATVDDLVLPIMAVPVNEPVELILRSKDVTHAFNVRELRLRQDMVPGMVIRVHFTAEKTGTYEIACVELCGLGHQRMRSFLQVLSRPDYEKWLRDQAAPMDEEPPGQ